MLSPSSPLPPSPLLWGNLLHLSYNMWSDWSHPDVVSPYNAGRPFLRFDDALWDELLHRMADAGFNAVLIDLGDGVRWETHPEIAVENAWSTSRLREELDKARSLGLEPLPKLNFSTCHDYWMGPYARRISTPEYYAFCADLIAETIALFDKPRLFHLGMDEEDLRNQRHFEYVVIRQYDLWWRDLQFLLNEVEKGGARPWVWSDYRWEHPETFDARMPRTVLQSNWYYGVKFDETVRPAYNYAEIDAQGFNQVPTFSNWTDAANIANTVQYCCDHCAPQRLQGFLLAPWRPTLAECRDRHINAIDATAQVIKAFGNTGGSGA